MLILSFHHVDSGHRAQIIQLGSKCLTYWAIFLALFVGLVWFYFIYWLIDWLIDCICVHVWHWSVERSLRIALWSCFSLFSLCGFWGWNSGHQACMAKYFISIDMLTAPEQFFLISNRDYTRQTLEILSTHSYLQPTNAGKPIQCVNSTVPGNKI